MTGARVPFLLVSTCYQVFTLSDGALRMLVLLHLSGQGRTPWMLAMVLLPYEIVGVLTNLLGGWLGSRFGLKLPLLLGLWLQAVACLMLAGEPSWLSVPFLMGTQVLSGIAKDLTKTAAKSYTRTLANPAGGGLFAAVAWLTGSKNVTKGLGFFLGGALLAYVGFRGTNAVLAGLLLLLALLGLLVLPRQPGRPTARLAAVVDHGPPVRWLAAARLFLFASRDAWFTIAVPLFLLQALRWSPAGVGAFLSAWVIGYGLVQAAAPGVLRLRSAVAGARRATWLTAALLLPLTATAACLWCDLPASPVLLTGLCLYGVLFALDSSLHSWLVLAIADGDDTVERVGFYYAANSAGRVAGLVGSGLLFGAFADPAAGLVGSLLAAAALVLLATVCTVAVRPAADR